MSFLPVMRTCCLGLMLIAAGITRAHGAELDMTIAVPPTPVRVEGHQQLDYEVQLINRSGHRLALEEFVVLDGRDGQPLARLSGKTLEQHAVILDAAPVPSGAGPSTLPATPLAPLEPGQRAAVFIDVALPASARIEALRHRVGYRVDGARAAARRRCCHGPGRRCSRHRCAAVHGWRSTMRTGRAATGACSIASTARPACPAASPSTG